MTGRTEFAFDYKRLEELALCLIARADHIGAIKLEKLLYLCDFIAAERLGAPITGEIYRHFDNGPVAKHLVPVLKDMEAKKILSVEKIKLRNGKPFTKYTARRKCSGDVFTKERSEIIEEVLRKFGTWTWKELVDYVHQDLTFRLTERNDDIPYFLAPYRRYEKPRKEEAEKLLGDSDYVKAIEAALT